MLFSKFAGSGRQPADVRQVGQNLNVERVVSEHALENGAPRVSADRRLLKEPANCI
ncbi:MAG: hypothetical protein ABSE73_09335 [Planctomycetota bacterium]